MPRAYDAEVIFDEDEIDIEHVAIDSLGTIAYDDVYRFDWKEEGKFQRKIASLSKKGDVIELVFGDDTLNCCLLSKVTKTNVRCSHVPADWR